MRRKTSINIFEYIDYRKFLCDFFKNEKKHNKYFSFQVFANRAKISSRSYTKMVMDGKRNLSNGTILKFADAMQLNKTESQYFHSLVMYQNSKTLEEKDKYYENMISFKKREKVVPLEKAQYELFSKWYIPVVRELITLKDFKEDYDWIADTLNRSISPNDAKKAVEILLALNLLKRENDKLTLTNTMLTSYGHVSRLKLRKFNKAIAENALSYFDLPDEIKELSTLTISLKKEDVPKIKTFLQEMRGEINKKFTNLKDQDAVYQFNFHMFPVTKI